MTTIVRMWLVIGSPENWDTAFAQPLPLWGLRQTYAQTFAELSPGDLVAVYVIKPVRGIVGFGSIKDKYIDRRTVIWNEERTAGKVIWPLRFRISNMTVLPRNRWVGPAESSFLAPIDISDYPIFWQRGFHLLTDQQMTTLLGRATRAWGDEFLKFRVKEPSGEYQVAKPEVRREPVVLPHKKIQEGLVEIGRLQYYYPETEFVLPLEGEYRRLDVVWKRELAGVPTFVFEVELSGSIEKAVTKLRMAYNAWNSRPRLVIPESYQKTVESLIAREQSDFRQYFRCYDPAIVDTLLAKKQDLRAFEDKHGLY